MTRVSYERLQDVKFKTASLETPDPAFVRNLYGFRVIWCPVCSCLHEVSESGQGVHKNEKGVILCKYKVQGGLIRYEMTGHRYTKRLPDISILHELELIEHKIMRNLSPLSIEKTNFSIMIKEWHRNGNEEEDEYWVNRYKNGKYSCDACGYTYIRYLNGIENSETGAILDDVGSNCIERIQWRDCCDEDFNTEDTDMRIRIKEYKEALADLML